MEKISISKKFIKVVVSQIDLFGQAIALNINKKTNYKTFFGGVGSILIIGILIVFFFSNVLSFLNQDEIIFTNETTFQVDPDSLIMTFQNFMVAFSIEQEGYAINPYFNITVEQKHYYRDNNGTVIYNTTSISLEPCTLNHFQILLKASNFNFEDQFNQLNLSYWLCPSKNYQFNLSGIFSSKDFNFIKISVTDCLEGNISDSGWNPQCASETEKQKVLKEKGKFKLQIYSINSIINPYQTKNYIKSYLDQDLYFTFNPKNLMGSTNLFYRKYQFFNDISLFPIEDIQKEETIGRQNSDSNNWISLGKDTDNIYQTVYLRRSQFTEVINRRFVKIIELLSYLGGFLQFMTTALGCFIIYYNKISMFVELSNKLYNFQSSLKTKYIKNKIKENQVIDCSQQLDQSLNIQQQDLGLINNSKDYFLQTFLKQLLSNKKIHLSFKLIVNQLSFGYLFNNEDAQLLNTAMQNINMNSDRVNNDLNITDILYKIQEIQKLKQVLLRKPQMILFNFISKPFICLDQLNLYPNEKSLDDILDDQLNIEVLSLDSKNWCNEFYQVNPQIIQAYLNVKNEQEIDQLSNCQKKLNNRLLNDLGPQITDILKHQEQIQIQERQQITVRCEESLIQTMKPLNDD